MHLLLPSSPIALAPLCLVVCFCERGLQTAPRNSKGGPRPVERFGDTTAMLARVKAGIEAARPAPLRRGNGSARAPADYTAPHVVEVDKPRFAMGTIFAAAAGERRHAAIKAAPDEACKLSIACVSRRGRHAAAHGCGQWPAGITAAGHRLRYLGLGVNRQR